MRFAYIGYTRRSINSVGIARREQIKIGLITHSQFVQIISSQYMENPKSSIKNKEKRSS